MEEERGNTVNETLIERSRQYIKSQRMIMRYRERQNEIKTEKMKDRKKHRQRNLHVKS